MIVPIASLFFFSYFPFSFFIHSVIYEITLRRTCKKNYFFSFILKIVERDDDKFEYKRRMEKEKNNFGQWGFHRKNTGGGAKKYEKPFGYMENYNFLLEKVTEILDRKKICVCQIWENLVWFMRWALSEIFFWAVFDLKVAAIKTLVMMLVTYTNDNRISGNV